MTEPKPECPNVRKTEFLPFSCCFFPVVLSIFVTEYPNVRMTEFIWSPTFVRQKNRFRTFVRMSGPEFHLKFGQPEPEFINPNPTRFVIRTRPNFKFGQKNDDQTRFFWVGQIRVFGSDNFLPALI